MFTDGHPIGLHLRLKRQHAPFGTQGKGETHTVAIPAPHLQNPDTLIGIAASGSTPYVIGALTQARAAGILTASISSNPDSPMAEVADVAIEVIVGPEFVTGSSRMKSGTAQKMVLNMISTSVMICLGRVKGNRMVNMQLTNKKLVDRGTKMVAEALSRPYDQAHRLLCTYGSVQAAIDAVNQGKEQP